MTSRVLVVFLLAVGMCFASSLAGCGDERAPSRTARGPGAAARGGSPGSDPFPGTYRVIHPFGSKEYVVTVAGAGREINQTQDVGILAPLDFLASLSDAPPPPPNEPVDPAVGEIGVVNTDGASI